MKYAGVIVDILGGNLDRIFTYRIPESLKDRVEVGQQVEVPFGSGNRRTDAYVVSLMDTAPIEENKIKEILRISEKGIQAEGQLIQLAWWMKEQYGSSMLQAMKTVLPVRQTIKQKKNRTILWNVPLEEARRFLTALSLKRNAAQIRLLTALIEEGELPEELAEEKLHVSRTTIETLKSKGIIREEEETSYRNPLTQIQKKASEGSFRAVSLNPEQQAVVDGIREDRRKGLIERYLIHGVTGSGKTEVYMELIDGVLREGKQAILLIPEIALTYQTVMRFYRRFGDRVSILNSRMSAGERYDQFLRAKRGEVSIMVGPRSALFTPFSDLGIIIIDEEHETSYKSETAPRYQTSGVAAMRAQMCKASLVFGSATPSLETYYDVQEGRCRLYQLSGRAVEHAVLPQVEIVDMREELEAGNKSILSRSLASQIAERLARGEQTMLFLNRRGYSGFISCRACGKSIHCPHCDVSLTLHRNGSLRCHYCGYETRAPRLCPSCGSRYIAGFGIGTQKVETMVASMFPEARILRMDADTTSQKGGHEKILSAFAEEKADILIGTQMIVKGHDFPKVTLVGILAADLSLNTPAYDSAERTFHLLTQAAGRAGRGNLPGNVVIQTYCPDHYSIRTAAAQDYNAFYEEEILNRKMLHYPPVYSMMTILFSSKDEKAAERAARSCAAQIEGYAVERIGPCDAAVSKIKDVYRKVLYVRHKERKVLVHMKNRLEQIKGSTGERGDVLMQFDITGSIAADLPDQED